MHVFRPPDERQRDVIDVPLGAEAEVVQILLRQRGQVDRAAPEGQSRATRHRPATEDGRGDGRPADGLHAKLDLAVAQVDRGARAHCARQARVGGRENEPVAAVRAARGEPDHVTLVEIERRCERADAELWALQVADDRERLAGLRLYLSHHIDDRGV